MKYLLGVDIGTTSLKAVVFDENANQMKSITKDYKLIVKGDIVELEPQKYWDMFYEALCEARAEYEISALSIDTQC